MVDFAIIKMVVFSVTLTFLTLHTGLAFDLTILHTNDVHGHLSQFDSATIRCSEASADAGECFGGVARIQSVVKQTRSEEQNVLLLDGGDQFQGTSWFQHYEGDAAAYFMNQLGYDAMTIGNHEFDLGTDVLARFLGNVTFPVVSANIDVSNEEVLQGLFTKSIIIEVGGEQIGIVGYFFQGTAGFSHSPVGGTIFEDEIEAVQKEVDKLMEEGVNKIIGLGHSGFRKDMEVAANVPGIDVIVGGHTDTFLFTGPPPSMDLPMGDYPTIVTHGEDPSQRTLVVQGGAYAKYLGRLDVTFDDNGDIVEFSGSPILLDHTVEQDPDILADIATWEAPFRNVSNQIIGKSNVQLNGSLSECCLKECIIGNLLTDAYVRAYVPDKPSEGSWTNASIGVEVCGNIRGAIEPGDIIFEDVVGVLPFRTTVDVVDLIGYNLRFLLEFSVAAYDASDPNDQSEFMQYSGVRVTYDLSRPPFTRIVELLVLCSRCPTPEYLPVVDNEIYSVLLSSYVFGFLQPQDVIRHQTGRLDTSVLREYIEQFSPIITSKESRISFVEQPAPPVPTMAPVMKMRKHGNQVSQQRKSRKQ